MRTVILIAIGLTLTQATANAQSTYVDPDGSTFVCMGVNQMTGQSVFVPGVNGQLLVGNPARARWDPSGAPYIIFDPVQIAAKPPYERKFIFFHECAHVAIPTLDEVAANCRALIEVRSRGLLSPAEEQGLEAATRALGPLQPIYLGSGTAFWNATVACAGPRP
jgi:hypothetical protein